MERHIGRVYISEEYLLELLGLKGGHIRNVWFDFERSQKVGLQIEHPDMPTLGENAAISEVSLEFRTEYVPIHVARINPPKGEK